MQKNTLQNILKGLNKLILNQDVLNADLELHWQVITKGIQAIPRREVCANPYELFKKLSRKHGVSTQQSLQKNIESLAVDKNVKKELLQLTPCIQDKRTLILAKSCILNLTSFI